MASKATNPKGMESVKKLDNDSRASHTNASFQGVPNDQGCASCVPLPAERRPWQFLAIRESAIELRAGFRD